MEMSDKLKPCRWCNDDCLAIEYAPRSGHFVRCVGCDAQGPRGDSREEAIAAWNTRYQSTCETCRWWKPEMLPEIEERGWCGHLQLEYFECDRNFGCINWEKKP